MGMVLEQSNNYLSFYDETIATLAKSPDSPVLKHRAVLALARAGSLEFALAEYKRYGLDRILEHSDPQLLEDIMALAGRLLKDLALQSKGDARIALAKKSAAQYSSAFKATSGFYSGINAASMALFARQAPQTIHRKAKAVLDSLPASQCIYCEDVYFSLATRAEALLLLGDKNQSAKLLNQAIDHDPLNYAAHASTLKQFAMILRARDDDLEWFAPFTPPKTAHYAGHIFTIGTTPATGVLTQAQAQALKLQISDTIQCNDIGYGYGALAAGSDILIAEAMLDEGVQLHVVLPVNPDLFIEHSVKPYGVDWVERFNVCLARASSVEIATQVSDWHTPASDCFSRKFAMGKAIMQSEHLCVDTTQLLIWDEIDGNKGTASGAKYWKASGRNQIVIPYPGPRPAQQHGTMTTTQDDIQIMLSRSDERQSNLVSEVYEAANSAIELQQKEGNTLRLGLHIGVKTSDGDSGAIEAVSNQLAKSAVPGGILVSEAFVSLSLLEHQGAFSMDYMGRIDNDGSEIRAFALRPKN